MRDFEPTYDQVWPLAPIPFIRSEPRQVRSTLDTGPKVEVERPLFGANWRPEQVQQSSASSRSSPPGSQSAADEPPISAITSRWLVRQGAPTFQLGPWLCQSQGAGISAGRFSRRVLQIQLR